MSQIKTQKWSSGDEYHGEWEGNMMNG